MPKYIILYSRIENGVYRDQQYEIICNELSAAVVIWETLFYLFDTYHIHSVRPS